MKKNLLISFVFLSSVIFAQNITMRELLYLRDKNLTDTEDFLTKKGWRLAESIPQEGLNFSKTAFVYGDTDLITAIIAKHTFYDKNRLKIILAHPKKYEELLSVIKSYNPQLIYSGISEDKKLVTVYQGATTTFVIKSKPDKNKYGHEVVEREITLLTNTDYEYGYKNWFKDNELN